MAVQIGNLSIQGTKATIGNPIRGKMRDATLVDLLEARTKVIMELELHEPDLMNKLKMLDWIIDRTKKGN